MSLAFKLCAKHQEVNLLAALGLSKLLDGKTAEELQRMSRDLGRGANLLRNVREHLELNMADFDNDTRPRFWESPNRPFRLYLPCLLGACLPDESYALGDTLSLLRL